MPFYLPNGISPTKLYRPNALILTKSRSVTGDQLTILHNYLTIMKMLVDINIERQSGVLIIKPEGRIDGNNAADFQTSLGETITEQDSTIIMNLSELSYISSAGLRAILLTAKSLQKQKAKFMLCALKPTIKGIFEISGFDKIITIHDSQTDALGAL